MSAIVNADHYAVNKPRADDPFPYMAWNTILQEYIAPSCDMSMMNDESF